MARSHFRIKTVVAGVYAVALAVSVGAATERVFTPIQELGKHLFFDENLSSPSGQSCATCHQPSAAFADPRTEFPTSAGVLPGRFGNRNTPSAAYAALIPALAMQSMGGGGGMGGSGGMGGGGGMDGDAMMSDVWVGGQFWDGRADSLEDQAAQPFLNPLEMHAPNRNLVVQKVRTAFYADLFLEVFGPGAFDKTDDAYERIAQAIAEYERSPELMPFNSTFDAWTRGEDVLAPAELRGLALFEGKGKCTHCHPIRTMEGGGMGGRGGMGMNPGRYQRAPVTNYRYRNLGIPKNAENPFYFLPRPLNRLGSEYVDVGLGATVDDPEQNGKFRVPSLRNVALTAPYGHNGYFRTLKEIVHFINTRDVESYPSPEVPGTVVRHPAGMPIPGPGAGVFGNFLLTDSEEGDLIAFLHALSDRFVP